MKKYYYKHLKDDNCYTEDFIKYEMQQGEEVEVYEAKKYEVDGYFWCK